MASAVLTYVMLVRRFFFRFFLQSWDDRPENHPTLKIGLVLLSLLLIILISIIGFNYFTYQRLFTDSGVFAAVAMHVLDGRLLYEEVWDHKPPMIYLINLIPVWLSDGSIYAIRLFESIYCTAALWALFFIVLRVFGNPGIALLSALAFHYHFLFPELFQGGNLTEEYGAYFSLAGILMAVFAQQDCRSSGKIFGFLAGFFFALAVFTKEPFLFPATVWLVFVLIPIHKPFSPIRGLYFLAGALTIVLMTFLLLARFGILDDWYDVLVYNMRYTENSNLGITVSEKVFGKLSMFYHIILRRSLVFQIFFYAGILSSLFITFVRKYRYFPWFCLLAFLADWAGIYLSGYNIEHYYLQILPSYILLTATGGKFIYDLLVRLKVSPAWLLVFLLSMIVLLDMQEVRQYVQRLTVNRGRVVTGSLTSAVTELKQEGDTLWVPWINNSRYYHETALLSPIRYPYIADHLFLDTPKSTGEDKRNFLTQSILDSPPAFIIVSDQELVHFRELGLNTLVDWIQQNYERFQRIQERDLYLLVRKSDD
jgi:hypothetical protein